jgi:hypothetical protein
MPLLTFLSYIRNLRTLGEIDEFSAEKQPDGSLKVAFVTSGVHPTLAQVKTLVWAVLGLPVQVPIEFSVEELQSGLVVKRYKVTVILKNVFPKLA